MIFNLFSINIMLKYAQFKCTAFASSLSPKALRKQQFPQKQMSVECNNPEDSNLESSLCCYQQRMECSDIWLITTTTKTPLKRVEFVSTPPNTFARIGFDLNKLNWVWNNAQIHSNLYKLIFVLENLLIPLQRKEITKKQNIFKAIYWESIIYG